MTAEPMDEARDHHAATLARRRSRHDRPRLGRAAGAASAITGIEGPCLDHDGGAGPALARPMRVSRAHRAGSRRGHAARAGPALRRARTRGRDEGERIVRTRHPTAGGLRGLDRRGERERHPSRTDVRQRARRRCGRGCGWARNGDRRARCNVGPRPKRTRRAHGRPGRASHRNAPQGIAGRAHGCGAFVPRRRGVPLLSRGRGRHCGLGVSRRRPARWPVRSDPCRRRSLPRRSKL